MRLKKSTLVILASVTLATVALAIGIKLRIGSTTPGVLTPGEMYTQTNAAAFTFYVADHNGTGVIVGKRGVATTNDISGLTTNLTFLNSATNPGTMYITNGLVKGATY